MYRLKRLTALLLSFCMLGPLACMADTQAGDTEPQAAAQETGAGAVSDGAGDKYDAYLERHVETAKPSAPVEVPLDSVRVRGGTADLQDGYGTYEGKVLVTDEESDIELTVCVPERALYAVRVEYYTLSGKGSPIERCLYIDGELPFAEAGNLVLSRVYRDKTAIRTDENGNDIRPDAEEVSGWYHTYLKDSSGLYNQAFQFYFSSGEHVIRLESVREPCIFRRITLCAQEEAVSYAVYQQRHADAPKAAQTLEPVQAEAVYRKSDYSIYAGIDRSSASTQPASAFQLKYNCIPADKFKSAGQWIQWELAAPEAGMYKIAVRFKQDSIPGGYVSRKIMLDGEVPFAEAEAVRFYYDSRWQTAFLGGEDGPYEFYLKAGKNVLTMEAVLGDMAPMVSRVEDCMNALNACYWDIVMVTGTSPDTFRDYYFETIIPDTLKELAALKDRLAALKKQIESQMQEKTSSYTTAFEKVIFDLEAMVARPKTIASKLSGFKANIGSLASWILEATDQPLALDYLMAAAPQAAVPDANGSFWQEAVHQIKLYAASYLMDYNSISSTAVSQAPITVWISSGRDQSLILKSMIDSDFIPQNGVGVKLQLVDASTLLRSIVAGISPDVVLSQSQTTPLNYAIRGAVLDLSQFEDFDEVAARFSKAAITPFRYRGACYALPETLSFPMLFYRKDILEELGAQPPETWEDVSALMLLLSTNDLEFGLPANLDTFLMMLFQSGIELYNDDFTAVNLNSQEAYAVFSRWCDYYLTFGLDVTYDFSNRFRTGEMPIGIADFITTYNQLSVFAPEIRGKWVFTSVPGTRQADGTVSHTVSPTVTGAMVLSTSKYPEACWKFLKWWTDADIQLEYGRELESVVGIGARYASANEQAVAQSAWPVKDYKNIRAQWNWIQGVPECPGSYMTSRYIDFAFKSVINDNQDSTSELIRYAEMINSELIRKQAEFARH